jgi:hypothetical protein
VFPEQYTTLYLAPPTSSEASEDSDNPDYILNQIFEPFFIGSNTSVNRSLPATFLNRRKFWSNHLDLTREFPLLEKIQVGGPTSTLVDSNSGTPTNTTQSLEEQNPPTEDPTVIQPIPAQTLAKGCLEGSKKTWHMEKYCGSCVETCYKF